MTSRQRLPSLPVNIMRYVAFLAGINLGKRRVKMERLRELFEDLNFANVDSFIASGNLIFDTKSTDRAALETKIEQHLHQHLGYQVGTYLRQPDEIERILSQRPFDPLEMQNPRYSVNVSFLKQALPRGTDKKLRRFFTPMDEFRLIDTEFYWLCRSKITDSLVSWSDLGKVVSTPSTMRNRNTLVRILPKL